MQGSFNCCEKEGELVQSGAIDWKRDESVWKLTINPKTLSAQVEITNCPFDGDRIEDSYRFCMETQDLVEQGVLQLDDAKKRGTLKCGKETAVFVIEYCPFCGSALGKYEPARIG